MYGRKILTVALLAIVTSCVAATSDEKVLYEKNSSYNTIIVTENSRGLRTLRFEKGGARQSVVKVGDPDHIELPYARVMSASLAFVKNPQRVLIVGLGGGTIPNFLHKHFPQVEIDVVDIDADVVDVAKRFFGFQEDATLHVHVADGRRFIEESRNHYDVVFLDAFGSENIPYHLATREFLHSVREILAPGGVVAGNIWSRNSNRLYDSMIKTYQDVYEELYILDVRGAGNEILIALPRKQQIDRDDLARRARDISCDHQFPFDMGDLVEYGFQHADWDDPRGWVLTDKNKSQSFEP
jgi:spermidine synthase